MAQYATEEDVAAVFEEFWNKSYDEIYTTMAGMADVWEGPLDNTSFGENGYNTIISINIYNDKIFVVQGGGLRTFVKVFSPNGLEIYDLGTRCCLMVHNPRNIYGSVTIINEYELIIGYVYVNLKMLFAGPFGLDLSTLWNNPAAKMSSARINSISWITAYRDNRYWSFVLNSKASPEDCLGCETKEKLVSGNKQFACKEEAYGYEPWQVDGYKADRTMLASGVGASVSVMDGYGLMDRITKPSPNPTECLKNIDDYVTVFNKKEVDTADVGVIGQKMSENCSSAMYGNMIQTMQYRRDSEAMHDSYIKQYISGTENNQELINQAKTIAALIAPMLGEMKDNISDNESLRSVFKDQVWWGPLWFVANEQKILSHTGRVNPYVLLHTVKFDDFVNTLKSLTYSLPAMSEYPALDVAWIVMAEKGRLPIKFSTSSMTYFRFPFMVCMATEKLFTIGNMEIDSICDIETRPDGFYIWAWQDNSTLNNRMHMNLKLYKFDYNAGVILLDTYVVGYDETPIENSAKSARKNDDKWIIRDYFYDGEKIDSVVVSVDISKDMSDILASDQVLTYANVNEINVGAGGSYASSKGDIHYGDGLLERDHKRYDLNDSSMETGGWGNNGKQFEWVKGYSGYQIASANLL